MDEECPLDLAQEVFRCLAGLLGLQGKTGVMGTWKVNDEFEQT